MKVEIKATSNLTLNDLFSPCKICIYWEAPEYFGHDEQGRLKLAEEKAIAVKQDWFEKAMGIFGCCGMILYAEGEAVGYAQYAPPRLLSNVAEYSQTMSSPSPDAVLISCLYVQEEYQGRGLGKKLLLAILENLRQRGYHAVETYARDDSGNNCSGPTEFYLRNGFGVVETKKWEQATFSLMRLEIDK